ncbi:hypothetical protein JW872_00570 [Candidatus Babeliales bacterium]|nr:hypothetical protein [Candidatus Babeliales bacterium]
MEAVAPRYWGYDPKYQKLDTPDKAIILPTVQFIRILETWDRLLSEQPQEIIIKDGDEIRLEGRNPSP